MTMPHGASVSILGSQVNGFVPVRYGQTEGYASAAYMQMHSETTPIPIPAATPTPTPAPLVEYITPAPQGGMTGRVVVTSDNGLNLRAEPNGHSRVVYVLPYGMVLTVLGEAQNGFMHVQWAGYEGYVSSQYVAPLGQ